MWLKLMVADCLSKVGVTPPPSTAGIVTPANAILPSCKMEILELMKTVIEKCSQQVTLQLLEVSTCDCSLIHSFC